MRGAWWSVALAAAVWSGSAQAAMMEFTAELHGDTVRPDPVKTPAFGMASFILDPDTGRLSYTLVVSKSLLSSTEFEAAVYGPATHEQTGYRIFDLGLGQLKQGVVNVRELERGRASDLLAGHWYVQVCTEGCPGGELRGQLALVPELSTLLLLGAGVSVLAVGKRRPG